MDGNKEGLTRRDFLKKAGAAGIVLASGSLLGAGARLALGREREQTAEIKTDILIFETAYDPINGLFWTIGRHPSKGDAMGLYKGRYSEGKISWQKITEFPWMGTLPGMVAVSPTEPNILTVAGGEKYQQGPGKILISKDGGQNFQEITVPDMGAVNYVAFSKNGDKIYYSTNNYVATAGIVVKVNVSDNRREAAANNGLEGMQNFGGPILASPNNNETLYAVSGIAPQILVTRDGGQNWTVLENLPTPPNSDSFRVFSHQGKDVTLISGNGWLKIIKEGEQTIDINTAAFGFVSGFTSLAVDANRPEMEIYGAISTDYMAVGSITQESWRRSLTLPTGLPTDKIIANLKPIVTSDSRKFLTGRVLGTSNSSDSSGFWAYDLSQGETNGSWQQEVEGLEYQEPATPTPTPTPTPDPFSHKVYLPSVFKNRSGGW